MIVPFWKRTLSRIMTAAINGLEANSDRRPPHIPLPTEDPWYESHEDLAAIAPGTLLSDREVEFRGRFTLGVTARSWQMRYRSNNSATHPISAVATLMVPTRAWTGKGPRPLVSYQAAIDSLGPRADPSYVLQRGNLREFILILLALRRGWAVIVSDYTGPLRAFGAGVLAAHITLDGVRASFQLDAAGLAADAPVALWGYSGGGQATAWAAEIQPTYAPDIRLTAVAAGGVPTDSRTLYRIDGGFLAGFALGGWVGISREYPELDLLADANDDGRRVFEEVADMTIEELLAYFPFRSISELSNADDPFATPSALEVNDLLSLGRRLPSGPVYIYHTIFDQLVPIAEADELAAKYRRGGVDVTLKRSRLGEHVLFHRLAVFGVLRYLAPRLEAPPAPREAAAPGQSAAPGQPAAPSTPAPARAEPDIA